MTIALIVLLVVIGVAAISYGVWIIFHGGVL